MSSRLAGTGAAAPLGLVNLAPATVPLVVQGAVGQTADMLDIDTSKSTTTNPSTLGFINSSAGTATRLGVVAPGVLYDGLQMGSGQSTQLVGYYGLILQGNAQPVSGPTFPGALADRAVHIPITHSVDIGLVIQGAASQSADLQRWTNSTPTTLAKVTSAGDFACKTIIPGTLDTMTYATTIALDVTLAEVHKTTTVNATGNATINASAAGIAGQRMTVIIVNDATSGKTITFGSNLKPNGALVGTASKAACVSWMSDGTAFYEVCRQTGL